VQNRKKVGVTMLRVMVLIYCALQVSLVESRTTANSKKRQVVVDAVVLHSISGPYCKRGRVAYSGAPGDAHRWLRFFASHKVLGIHYIVDRQGLVLKGVAENRVANHALGWNGRSIGIELVHNGDGREKFTPLQWQATKALVNRLIAKYPSVNKKRVFRHSDVDTRTFNCGGVRIKKKQDPGNTFDYSLFIDSLN